MLDLHLTSNIILTFKYELNDTKYIYKESLNYLFFKSDLIFLINSRQYKKYIILLVCHFFSQNSEITTSLA